MHLRGEARATRPGGPAGAPAEGPGRRTPPATLAQSCYDRIYGEDPLEEGELDTRRGPMFRECASADLRTPERQGDVDAASL